MNINLTLLGSWWLIIILAITAALFVWGLSRHRSANREGASSQSALSKPSNDLIKLDELIAKHMPMTITTLRHNRIIIQKPESATGQKRTIMLTIDKKIAAGSRQLGEATVINFHKVPAIEALKQSLESIDS